MDERFFLTGLLKGKLVYDYSTAAAGTTTGSLSVSGMRIGLESPLLGIGELVTEQTSADFFFDGQTLRLKALVFDGPMLDGKISGSVQLRRPLEHSRLSLGGNAKVQPELIAQLQETIPQGVVNTRTLGTRGLNFRIGGTIGSPDVSLR
jgi:type II secretion system protein N